METIDLSKFMEETESADTIAYDYALEISHLAVSKMQEQGLTKKELAERMGVSPQRLANILNTQPNMTLKTIAQLSLALGICVEFSSEPVFTSEVAYEHKDAAGSMWAGDSRRVKISSMAGNSEPVHFSILKGGLAA